MLEEKIITAHLLRRYRFDYDMRGLGPVKIAADLILKPKDTMPLAITRRRSRSGTST